MTTHKRLRRFNTKDTYPEQKLDNDLCQTVVARGTMVFVRGQIGQDLETRESVAIGDPAGQAERAMANIDMLLREAGSKLEHICKITIYIVDPRYREPVPRCRQMAEGCLPGLYRACNLGPRPAGMAGRDRRDRCHSG